MICSARKNIKADGLVIPKDTRGKIAGIQLKEDGAESYAVLFDGIKDVISVDKSSVDLI